MYCLGAVRRHDAELAPVIGGELALKPFYIFIVVPAVAHAVFDHANFMVGDPRPGHIYLFHFDYLPFLTSGTAGAPTTIVFGGTSFTTTAPAPTMAFSPTVMRGNTVAPAQIHPFVRT